MPDFSENSPENTQNEPVHAGFSRIASGLLFSEDRSRVFVLLGDDTAGAESLLKVPEGPVGDGEIAAVAIRRVFSGLAGHDLDGWDTFCMLSHGNSIQYWLRRTLRPGESVVPESGTLWAPVEFLENGRFRTANQLGWLVPLALDRNVGVCLAYRSPLEK